MSVDETLSRIIGFPFFIFCVIFIKITFFRKNDDYFCYCLPAREGNGHGMGCQSIAFFERKNGGVLQYQLEGRWLHMRLLL